MCHQPRLAYATRHGTFQQTKNIPAEKNSEREKTTATMVNPPYVKVEALKDKYFVWMWLIKVYKCCRSAICSLNLDPRCRYGEITT